MVTQVETVLNQMKRSDRSQTTIVITAVGQTVIPYAESRVALAISSHPTSPLTLSMSQTTGVGLGITIPAAGAPLLLSLGSHGSMVKGPIYLADPAGTLTITYWESLNSAP